MGAPFLLLAVSLALAALGVLDRVAPHWVGPPRTLLCAAGVLLALGAGDGATAGLLAETDGVSRAFLLALFLLAAAGWQGPVALGGTGLALLSADAALLVAGTALAAGAAVLGTHAPMAARRPPPLLARATASRLVVVAVLCLVAALLLQGRLDLQVAAMRGQTVEGARAALLLVSVLAAAALLAVAVPGALGGLLAAYLLARLLLDLPGPVTPGWWGVPVLAAGAGGAVAAAWRAASSSDLRQASDQAGLAAAGLAAAGFGAALLARGADLRPAASLGAGGALLAVLAWAAWGGALHLGSQAVATAAGGTDLPRLGGLGRRAPWTALAVGTGLLSVALLPFSAGFAAFWTVAQAVFAAGRAGGEAAVLAAAAAAAGLGLAAALGTAAAVRLGAAVLLGTPRSGKAASATDPPRTVRLAAAGYAALALAVGVLPGPVLLFVQPGVRLLAGAPADGVGIATVASTPDAPGYAAPILALVLALALLLLGIGRGPVTRGGPAWTGGFIEAGTGQAITPAPAPPPIASWRSPGPAALLGGLAILLAALAGWAAAR